MPSGKLGGVFSVNKAIQQITRSLDGTYLDITKVVNFDGWSGFAASAVLKAIAQAPPLSLKKKFDKIIHIDCSRWKSRRALQRVIADELNLPQRVMAAFDLEDEEDDFSGVDEGSRAEIASVTMETYQAFKDITTCLVIFHNGSDSIVDFSDFGFPQFNWFSPGTLLWTFRGRLRLNLQIEEKLRGSNDFYLWMPIDEWEFDNSTSQLILEEAAEVVRYTQHKQSITPRIAAKCISYLLWLNKKGGGTMEYNWGTHASNYWVCDGIIEDSHFDESWEISAALHQQIRLEDCSSHTVNFPDDMYTEHWKSVVYTSDTDITVSPKLTSFFLAVEEGFPLLRQMFQLPKTLRVLKLCGCNFSFCSPPFQYCRRLRFLGLDSCKDQRQDDEHDKQGRPVMEFFETLFVLDISNMDWELDLPQDIIEQMAVNIREVHVKKGRIWGSSLAWRQLKNIRKLRIINPTSSGETGRKDEFIDMAKLELLDLSGNNVMQVLPSLCGATRLKTLVLDGCAGLEHIGPKELPPSLESFSFNAGAGNDGRNTAKISCISLNGSAKLVDFRLLGSMPNLEELDLSGTAVKVLELKKVDQAKNLQRIFLVGCKQLRAIVWPETGMQQLRLVCIDTRQEAAALTETSHDSLVCQEQEKYCHAHVCITDMRFIQSLLVKPYFFVWGTAPYKLNLYLSCTSKDDGKNCNKGTMCFLLNRTGQVTGSPSLRTSLISKTLCAYNDVSIEETATEINGGTALQFEPQHLHVEIGEGTTINTNMVSAQGIRAWWFLMKRVQSLYLHDNSSITAILLEPKYTSGGTNYVSEIIYSALKWCRVERCPMLETVFIFGDRAYCSYHFQELETFWAADLLMARSIWSGVGGPYPYSGRDNYSFAKLRAIHLHMCPRLQFVLPFSWNNTLPSLETLHIVCCRGLKQVFPVSAWFLNEIATNKHQDGMLEFPNLKHLYLHDLSSLQQICEAKIFAPKLETVRLRGCWGLRRLPATDRDRHRRDGRLVDVDCEKDWWERLEWDGLRVGHHPSLFAPRHSAYYKKRFLRTTVLR